jgi:23S rRNA pseudouridine1911/1915/1917 synthase
MKEETRRFVAKRGGMRLDQYLALCCPDLSRSQVARLIRGGYAEINSAPARPAQAVRPGDRVTLRLPEPEPSTLRPEAIPLRVVYEDPDILVVDKPPGLPIHPSPGHASRTLVNALLAHCADLSGVGGALRPGIVHRLDKDTSGLMVVAKHDAAHRAVAGQLQARLVEKTYLALVWGLPVPQEGCITGPIGRDPRNRKRMAVVDGGREACTHYRTLRALGEAALLEVRPKTGRTHQVRVHLASLGHPLVGDMVYGRRKTDLVGRHFLHAHRLRFRLPSTGQHTAFEAPLPPDLRFALEALEGQSAPSRLREP